MSITVTDTVGEWHTGATWAGEADTPTTAQLTYTVPATTVTNTTENYVWINVGNGTQRIEPGGGITFTAAPALEAKTEIGKFMRGRSRAYAVYP